MELLTLFKEQLLQNRSTSSKSTLKNYISDVKHFILWCENLTKREFDAESITPEIIKLYQQSLGGIIDNSTINSSTQLSTASMKRHLSSLRKFFSLLKKMNAVSKDPFEKIEPEVTDAPTDLWHLKSFKDYLQLQKASKITIKNYLSDISGFAKWYEETILPGLEKPLSSTGGFYLLTQEILEDYRKRLLEIQNAAPRTVNRKLSALRRYLAFVTQKGFINTSEFTLDPVQVYEQNLLTPQPSLALSELPKAEKKEKTYSKFPPLRLVQKIFLFPYLTIEEKAAILIATIIAGRPITGIEKLPPKLSALIESKNKIRSTSNSVGGLLRIKNVSKEFYAPEKVSLLGTPLYKRALYHFQYTRPNWYKRYHNYSFVHYVHFALLVIFASGVGVALYQNLVVKKQTPIFAAPTNPPRLISFQGRLTDNLDNPISSSTNLRFAIYNDSTASGAALLWQEAITNIAPDQDGIFSVYLGNGTQIPSTVFTDNANIYLGVTVASTPELTPRQRIASVGYATSAEFLQGMPPTNQSPTAITSFKNVILALDSNGNFNLNDSGAADHTFQVGNGAFILKGQTLNLATNLGSNGNIILTPDGLGKTDIQKPLINTTSMGNLTPGGVEVNDKFGVLATESAVAAFIVNNNTSGGDIFAASSSGTTRFAIQNDGTLVTKYTTAGGIIFGTNSSGVLGQTTTGALGQCLQSAAGGTPTWGACGASYWDLSSGALMPGNDTLDLLVGGHSTASAKFRFLNSAGGTPVASVSANSGNNATFISGDGTLGTTNRQTLTIGNSSSYNTTGNILINPNGIGRIGIGTTTPLVGFDLRGNSGTTAAASLSANTSFATLMVDNSGTGDLITASASGVSNFVVKNNGDIVVGLGGSGKITAGVIDPYLIQNQKTSGTQSLTFQTLGATNADFIFKNTSTTLSTLTMAGQFQLPVTGSTGGILLGGDTQIFRGAADRIDVASGDSLNLVSGSVQVGGSTVIDASRNATFQTLNVTGGCTGCTVGAPSPFQVSQGAIVPLNSTLDLLVGAQASQSAKFAVLNIASGTPTASVSATSTGAGLSIAGDGTLQGTLNNAIAIGGNTTGSIQFKPNNNSVNLFLTGSNVAIGNQNPQASLDVSQNSHISASVDKIIFGSIGNTIGVLGYDGGANDEIRIGAQSNKGLELLTNNTTQAYITNTGDFGIGTTSPTAKLDVSGAASVGGQLTFRSGTAQIQSTAAQTLTLGGNTTGDIQFKPGNASSATLYLTTGGNIGIGTTSPGTALDVVGSLLLGANSTIDARASGTLTIGNGANTTGLTLGKAGATTTFNSTSWTATPTISGLVTGTSGFSVASGQSYTGTGAVTLSSGSNTDLTVTAQGSGNLILTSDLDTSVKIGTSVNTSAPLSVSGGIGLNAAFILNQANSGDLLAASASGTTKFVIKNDGTASSSAGFTIDATGALQTTKNQTLTIGGGSTGNIVLSPTNGTGSLRFTNFTTNGGILYTNGTGILSQTGAGSASQCLIGGTTPSWGSCTTGTTASPFQEFANVGVITENNTTEDFLIGATATTSAKFAVLNIAGGTPTASVSSGLNGNGAWLDANGNFQTANKRTLTLGGGSTGNITIQGNNILTIVDQNISLSGINPTFSASGTNTLTLNNNATGNIQFFSSSNTLTNTGTLTIAGNATINGGTIQLANGSQGTIQTASNADIVLNAGSGTINLNTTANGPVLTGTGLLTAGGSFRVNGATTTFANAAPTITTGINTDLTVSPNGTGSLILSTDFNTGVKIGDTTNTVAPLSVSGGIGLNAAVIFNQTNAGDIFTASSSGTTKFTISNSGNITDTAATSVNFSNAALTVASCTGCGSVTPTNSPFQVSQGAIVPGNATLDFMIGAQATTSAKFAVLNVNNGTPTASVSSGLNGTGAYFDANGNFNTVKNMTLSIGSTTTGNVVINPTAGGKFVGIGTSSPQNLLDIQGTSTAVASVSATTNGNGTAIVLGGDGSIQSVRRNTLTIGGSTTGNITVQGNGILSLADATVNLTGTNPTIGATGSNTLTINGNSTGNIQFFSSSNTLSNAGALTIAGNATINGTTLQIGNGSNSTIQTATNGNLTLTSAGSGELVLSTDADSGVNIGTTANTPAPLSVSGGIGLNAAFILNQANSGDLLAASASGITKFVIKNDGTASSSAGFTLDGVGNIQSTRNQTLTVGGGSTGNLIFGRTSQVVTLPGFDCSAQTNGGKLTTTSGGVLTCSADTSGASGFSSPFKESTSPTGSIFALNSTEDVLLGGQASTSAALRIIGQENPFKGTLAAATISANTSFAGLVVDNKGVGDLFTASSSGVTQFQIKNGGQVGIGSIAANTPTAMLDVNGTASISSALTFRTGAGNIQTTANNSLTIGGLTTGNISISPLNGAAGSLFTLNSVTATFNGTTTLNASSLGTVTTASGLTLSGTTSLTASTLATITTAATLALNGASTINTNQSNLTLFNSTATTLSFAQAATTLNIGASAGSINVGNGGNSSITTTSNGNLTLGSAGSGNTTISSDFNSSVFVGSATTPAPLSISGGIGSNAALVLNQLNSGDIFAASASGSTKFVLSNTGLLSLVGGQTSDIDTLTGTTLKIGATTATTLTLGRSGQGITLPAFATNNNSVLVTGASGAMSAITTTTSGQCLVSQTSGNVPQWTTCPTGGSSGTWVLDTTNKVHYPINNTVDLIVGGTSTASAKFAVLNLNGTGPVTATVSGNLIVMPTNGAGGMLGVGKTSNLLASIDVKDRSSIAVQGSEKITNANDSTFAADTGNWTTSGSPAWKINVASSGKAVKDAPGTGVITLTNAALDSAPVSGNTYLIKFDYTTTSSSSGRLLPTFGGVNGVAIGTGINENQNNQTQIMKAAGTFQLTFTPSVDWYGTIDNVSVTQITTSSVALRLESSDGSSNPLEVRAGGDNLYNTFIGNGSGRVSTIGNNNVGVGYQALFSNTTGYYNTANGYQALFSNTTGYYNTANGYQALFSNTTGNNNTANGIYALYSNSTGVQNTANGIFALYFNTIGSSNTANGYQTLYKNTTGSSNTANGYLALYSNTTGNDNVANGVSTLYSNISGFYNSATGNYALNSNTTGNSNTAIGYNALYSNTSGYYNTANGVSALNNNTTGNFNSAHGYGAISNNTRGSNNVSMGYNSGITNTVGGSNTFLGYLADAAAGHLINASAIGANAYVGANDALVLGSIYGVNSATGSAKIGIGTIAPKFTLDVTGGYGSNALMSLNQINSGDIFTASSSGTTRLTLSNTGQLNLGTAQATNPNDYNAKFNIWSNLGTAPAASISAKTASASLIVNNDGVGDVFVASASGLYQFIIDNGGNTYQRGIQTGLRSDFAEYYKKADSNEQFQAGQLICISSTGVTKCTSQNSTNKIIGVISDNAFIVGNGGHAHDPNYVLVGMVGQLGVWVTGNVKAGDPLTFSTTPGVATKATTAGNIIGYAKADNNGAQMRVDSVIQPDYFNPNDRLQQDNVFASLSLSVTNGIYTIFDSFGNSINHIDAFSKAMIANLEVGFAHIRTLAADSISVGGQSLKDYIATTVNQILSTNPNLQTPLSSSDKVTTNVISPLADNSAPSITLKNSKINVDNGSKTVSWFDNSGNASFSGQLNSNSLQTESATISGNLAANNATIEQLNNINASISGTLTAGTIIADNIQGLDQKLATLAANINSQKTIDSSQNSTSSAQSSSSCLLSSGSCLLSANTIHADFGIFEQGITSMGPITSNIITATDQLSVGNTMNITKNAINTVGTDLAIQSLRQGNISFEGGLIKMDTDGNMSVNGNFNLLGEIDAVTGVFSGTLTTPALYTGLISPLPGDDLTIKLTDSATTSGKLKVVNSQNQEVLSINSQGDINASGAATFAKLNFNLVGKAEATSLTEAVATGSAGFATLRAGQPEITVKNKNVTSKSLIYITPFGDTGGKVLYLLRQVPAVDESGLASPTGGSFTVGLSGGTSTQDLQFNWLIVN